MMEKSCSSSLMVKSLPSKEDAYSSCSQEESGWTAYFEDFSNYNNNNNKSSLRDQKQEDDQEEEEEEEEEENSFGCTSSMVSDAASCAAWKLSSHSNQNKNVSRHACSNNFIGASPNNFLKKLSFKKTRTKKISGDDLEDTASSPVNSPKIGDVRPVGINPRRIDDHHMNFNPLGKEHFEDMEEADGDADQKTTDCCVKNESTDLKKKGLCLVPMSLLLNYLV